MTILLFLILSIRLFNVMIINNNKYSNKLKKLTTKYVSFSSAPRGRILDRNYNVLVDNKAIKTIVFKKNKNRKYNA